eukprot:4734477-Pyramimonas_sp.AAC.1
MPMRVDGGTGTRDTHRQAAREAWEVPWPSRTVLERSWGRLEHLEPVWYIWSPLGSLLGTLQGLLGPSWSRS